MDHIKKSVLGGTVLGMGFTGFIDGIVFHQILGWHHLICVTEHCQPTSIEHLQRQSMQDGFFHLAVLILTFVGSYLVFRHAPLAGSPGSLKLFFGALLSGAGIFNFVEGLINHQILGIHHIAPGSPYQLHADIAFLGSGVLFFAVGWFLTRQARAVMHTPVTSSASNKALTA
jgi:uncharacterized membrane protein